MVSDVNIIMGIPLHSRKEITEGTVQHTEENTASEEIIGVECAKIFCPF